MVSILEDRKEVHLEDRKVVVLSVANSKVVDNYKVAFLDSKEGTAVRGSRLGNKACSQCV